jgi:sporulation protein YlmC with PRC-barrel domain
MTKRISEFYGLDVYSVKGEYVGKVEEVILNLEKGVIMNLCLKPLKDASAEPTEVKRILQEDSISYDTVSAADEVVLIKSKPVKGPKAVKRKVMGDE